MPAWCWARLLKIRLVAGPCLLSSFQDFAVTFLVYGSSHFFSVQTVRCLSRFARLVCDRRSMFVFRFLGWDARTMHFTEASNPVHFPLPLFLSAPTAPILSPLYVCPFFPLLLVERGLGCLAVAPFKGHFGGFFCFLYFVLPCSLPQFFFPLFHCRTCLAFSSLCGRCWFFSLFAANRSLATRLCRVAYPLLFFFFPPLFVLFYLSARSRFGGFFFMVFSHSARKRCALPPPPLASVAVFGNKFFLVSSGTLSPRFGRVSVRDFFFPLSCLFCRAFNVFFVLTLFFSPP